AARRWCHHAADIRDREVRPYLHFTRPPAVPLRREGKPGGRLPFTLVPYRRGWKPLSELRAEIGDNFFSTLELVNQSPRVDGTAFDPAALIRAVNELHACGKDGALQALSAYQLLARKDPVRNNEYDLDEERIVPILGLLLRLKKETLEVPKHFFGHPSLT